MKSYHVRGLVQEVAGTGPEMSVAIHHEPIPLFEGREGTKSDMESMTMIFGVAKDVPSSVLTPGDKIVFDFDVRWNKRPALYITHAEPLPATTDLALSTSIAH